MASLRHLGRVHGRTPDLFRPHHRRAVLLHLGQAGGGDGLTRRGAGDDAGKRLHAHDWLPSGRRRRPLGAAGAAGSGQSLAVAICEAGQRRQDRLSSSSVHYQSDIMPRLSQEPSFDGRVAEYGQNAHCSIELEERKWTRRSLDFWERWRRSGHSMPRRPRRPLGRLQPTCCGRIPSPTFSSRSRTRLRCCRRSMNPRRPRRRTKTFSLPSSTITTIIITTTTDMADIMGMMRRPASSSCLADTVITITTIITIITASIAATIEVARSDDDKTGPRGPVFFVDSTTSAPRKRGPLPQGLVVAAKSSNTVSQYGRRGVWVPAFAGTTMIGLRFRSKSSYSSRAFSFAARCRCR